MDQDKMFRFCFVFCLYVVIFVCIYNNNLTFLLVLIFSPKLFESWIKDYKILKDSVTAKPREVVKLDHVTLNIAVTGETGAGKSSFVNAIRGVQDTAEGAAPTGVTETSMEPTMYSHPTLLKVKLWDLPGIGGEKFKAETYMKEVKCQNYDFFIIVSASRFMENYMNLAKEIKKDKKNFYFVRTKTDLDVTQEAKKGVREEQTLEKIRKDCVENLRTFGDPPVFLMTSHNLERFDFQELVKTLERDLPDHKRDALVMSLPVYSKECLEQKYNSFKKYAWALAFASGAIAAIPIPGLATACDVAIVVSLLTTCYHSFGLDDGSLEKLSDGVNKDMLEMVRKSGLVKEICISTSFAKSIAVRFWAAGAIESLCILVPGGFGNIAAAGVSFATTKSVLLEGVDEMYEVAKTVLEKAEIP